MTSADQDDGFEFARSVYREWLKRCFDLSPEYHGKMMRGKRGGPFENYIPMTFSHTLIDLAGGMRSVREHWEPEK